MAVYSTDINKYKGAVNNGSTYGTGSTNAGGMFSMGGGTSGAVDGMWQSGVQAASSGITAGVAEATRDFWNLISPGTDASVDLNYADLYSPEQKAWMQQYASGVNAYNPSDYRTSIPASYMTSLASLENLANGKTGNTGAISGAMTGLMNQSPADFEQMYQDAYVTPGRADLAKTLNQVAGKYNTGTIGSSGSALARASVGSDFTNEMAKQKALLWNEVLNRKVNAANVLNTTDSNSLNQLLASLAGNRDIYTMNNEQNTQQSNMELAKLEALAKLFAQYGVEPYTVTNAAEPGLGDRIAGGFLSGMGM